MRWMSSAAREVLSACLLAGAFSVAARAQESASGASHGVFHATTLRQLAFEDGETLEPDLALAARPRIVIDGPGSAHVCAANWVEEHGTSMPGRYDVLDPDVAFELPVARELTGLVVLQPIEGPARRLGFRVPAASFDAQQEGAVHATQFREASARLRDGVAGGAWWRHRATALARELGWNPPGRSGGGGDTSGLAETFAFFGGGRAVAENLALDRLLRDGDGALAGPPVPMDSLPGIDVPACDWALPEGVQPVLDPLAAVVPADQHALFLPGPRALATLLERAEQDGPALRSLLPGLVGEDGTLERRLAQLGLARDTLPEALDPALVAGVALTGGDPCLSAGTDMALLLEARDAPALQAALLAHLAARAAGRPGLRSLGGTLGGLPYGALVTPRRDLCAWVARAGNVVVLCNSEAQLARLAAVAAGRAAALASQPEYAWFRQRYALGDPAETALLVLSDATIRRWCGPRWRIGASRRVQAEAQLAEVQAAWAESLACGLDPGVALVDAPAALGRLTLTPEGVLSDTWGTLGFLTPIAELDLAQASADEARRYAEWRAGYLDNWRAAFDPIAVRLGLPEGRLELDLTLRPLTESSEYRWWIEQAGRARLGPHSGGARANALVQLALAVDAEAVSGGEIGQWADRALDAEGSLAWLGPAIGITLDEQPGWDELEEGDWLFTDLLRLAMSLHFDFADADGMRAALENWSAGAPTIETTSHAGETIQFIPPGDDGSIAWAPRPQDILVATSLDDLRVAIDRRANAVAAPPPPAWLGEHAALRVEGAFIDFVDASLARQERSAWPDGNNLDLASFANIPILDEWHQLFPDEDPVAVHERLFAERLTCPGGGRYVWNEEWQTMESSVYGHPAEPRLGPALPPPVTRLARIEAGLTFEADGLRARVVLTHESP